MAELGLEVGKYRTWLCHKIFFNYFVVIMSLEVTFDGILLAEEGAAKWLEAMQEPAIDSDSDIDIKFIFIFTASYSQYTTQKNMSQV